MEFYYFFKYHDCICRNDRSSSVYIYIYWAVGPIRGHLVVRGRVNVITEVRISE